jgi:pimeloyl-ACP methyl ester carboxylesterase
VACRPSAPGDSTALLGGGRLTRRSPTVAHWIETLTDARPVWFEDAGHFSIEDHVEEILDRISAQ